MAKKFCYIASRDAFALIAFACLLGGCGHMVSGYSSIPYLEGAPPHLDNSVRTGIPKPDLLVPGAKLYVNLWNDVYTSAAEARAFNRTEPGDYVMLLQITPQTKGIVFEPLAVKLVLDGNSYAVTGYSGSENDQRIEPPRGRERRFASWDGRTASPNTPQTIAPMRLTEGCFYTLSLHFDAPKPNPDQDIALDLVSALKLPDGNSVPRIRFRKTSWQEMHQ